MNKMHVLPVLLSLILLNGGCAFNRPPPPAGSDGVWDGRGDAVVNVSRDFTIVSLEQTSSAGLSVLADRPVQAWRWNEEWIDAGLISGAPVSIDGSQSSYVALRSTDGRPVKVALRIPQPELATFSIQRLADLETLNLSAKGEEAQSLLEQLLQWLPQELETAAFIAELTPLVDDQLSSGITTPEGLDLYSLTRIPREGDTTCVDELPMYRAPDHQWHESGDGFCGHIATVRSLFRLHINGRTPWVDADDRTKLNPEVIKDIENKEGKERDSDGNVREDDDGNPINKNGMSDKDIEDAHKRLAAAQGAMHVQTKVESLTDINQNSEAGSILEIIMLDLKEIFADTSKRWDCTLTMSGTDADGKDFVHAEHVLEVVQPTKEETSTDSDGNTKTETVVDGDSGHITTVDGTFQGSGGIGEGIPADPRPSHSTYDNWAEKNQFNIEHGSDKSVTWKDKPGWTITKLGYVCVAFKK